MIIHPIEPVFNKNSKILILGSFPSVKSREEGFYYGHKQNRFWRVLSKICKCELPESKDDKKKMLLDYNIALWDVIKSCEIEGSSDSSITNVTVNDIKSIVENTDVKYIFTNGKKADNLYKKHLENEVKIKALCLPSTSPANASWSFEKLYNFWNKEISSKLFVDR